ncbi:MAG: hypothetical protein G01um101429_1117 [Parcubacteria group bacterium Gr01-1014_29]|nr:MAG: hypothetical protein G01um101429_1117 [Parcubacteria group bacterium Gr01-1014_29]
MSAVDIEKILQDIEKQRERFFPEAPLVVLERFPFYIKIRIEFKKGLFIEIRYNANGKRWSYVLVKDNKRVAGFDNLDGWHIHPKENPSAHKKITAPTLGYVFEYFSALLE